MHTSLIRILAIVPAVPISELSNRTLEDGPLAEVIPLHKKRDTKDRGNNNPVSLISVVCRVQVRPVKQTISTHMMFNSIQFNLLVTKCGKRKKNI